MSSTTVMSSTMVFTMTTASLRTDMTASCPGCGCDLPPPLPTKSAHTDLASAQERIAELELQVRQLNEKANSAIGRWVEYEAELGKLRGHQANTRSPSAASAASPTSPPAQVSPTRTSFLPSAAAISSILYPRKSSSANLRTMNNKPPALRTTALSPTILGQGTPVTPTTATTSMAEDLLEALGREQTLRQEAEGQLDATSKEMEELSAALFEQANEMVADERRARAKLEERVNELERRDFEKRQRLERLENAVERIDRVKKLLKQDYGNKNQTTTPKTTTDDDGLK